MNTFVSADLMAAVASFECVVAYALLFIGMIGVAAIVLLIFLAWVGSSLVAREMDSRDEQSKAAR